MQRKLEFYYPDRIEVHSPGLLPPGIRLDDLRAGQVPSWPRNPTLASLLRDVPGGYMERVGSGVVFMIGEMRVLGRVPLGPAEMAEKSSVSTPLPTSNTATRRFSRQTEGSIGPT